MHLNLYNAEDGKFLRTILEEKSDKWTEPEHPAFFPTKESNNFIWVSEKADFRTFTFTIWKANSSNN